MAIDVARAAEALSRPGIDPRTHVDLGVITHVVVDAGGCHCDVRTIAGIPETVALSPPYGGHGFGLYMPVAVDEFVAIAIPDGKYNAGGRIVGRTWDPGTPPPKEAIDNPDDVCLVVRPGQTLRIVVSGGGSAVIEARDGGRVKLGDETATSAAMNTIDGTDLIAALQAAAATAPSTGLQALTAVIAALGSLPVTAGAHAGLAWPVGADKVDIE
jgi:hypothetical protein